MLLTHPFFRRQSNLLLLVLGLLLTTADLSDAKGKKKKPSSRALRMCAGYPEIKGGRGEKILSWILQASSENSVLMSTSPQHQAACWMIHKDKRNQNKDQTMQRYALATLHYASTKSNTTAWDWAMAPGTPQGGYWMSKKHQCDWYGVHCNMRKLVTSLDLGFLKVDGILPRELYLLGKTLKDVDLHGNDLQGVLPMKMLDGLTHMEYFRLHMNGFFGGLHREIEAMKHLKELHMFGNYISGTIPKELSKLKDLTVIDLYANQLSGTIPAELGKLKKLRKLDLHDNNLVGTMPREICALKLDVLATDCLGSRPEVRCDCCTICCQGLPDLKCVDVKTGKKVDWSKEK